MKLHMVGLAVVALLSIGFTACGGDDNSGSGESATKTTAPASGGSASESTDQASSDHGSVAKEKGGKLEIYADKGGALKFEQTSAQVSAGKVELEFDNESAVPHDLKLEKDGKDAGGTDIATKGSKSAEVNLTAGTYAYYCSVDGHRDAGMEGKLTVK